jgi:hypothetical protein
MNSIRLTLTLFGWCFALVAVTTANPQQLSVLKGVGSTSPPKYCTEVDTVNASWYYTWQALDVCPQTKSEFVPMIWGEQFISLIPKLNKSAPALLGFNEPDHEQANMTAELAAKLWPLLEATGMRLGSPATTGTVRGRQWLDTFFAKCKGCRVDFIALHFYWDAYPTCDINILVDYINTFAAEYKRPIWLTEFSCMKHDTVDNIELLIAARDQLPRRCPMLERFAWFATRTSPTDPDYYATNLIDRTTNQLNTLGIVYARP